MEKIQRHLIILSSLISMAVVGAPFQQPGYHYLSPKPEATEVSRYARILLRFADFSPEHLQNLPAMIRLTGANGVTYRGSSSVASDNRTIVFVPEQPFEPAETIHVHLLPIFSGDKRLAPLEYTFQVSRLESCEPPQDHLRVSSLQKSSKTGGQAMIMPNGVSVPSDFPHVEVFVNNSPAVGYIFINNWGNPYYNMMLEPDGSPVWYQRSSDERRDMKVQKNGLITMLVRQGYPFGQGHIAMDNTYTVVDSFYAVDGCSTDEHELQILENGFYLLFGLRTINVDMSKIIAGGKKNARVSETGIQEFTPEGELIFHWRAWDHFDPRDMIGFSPDDQPTDNSFRFPHMNSIDVDDDGHLILSSKRLSEVTKIHRQTGEIIWRLGGANNEFTFINDPLNGFNSQHSVCALGDGRYTIFDNGCLHDPPLSRALEYKIDAEAKTATLVWSYVENPPTYAIHMGNVQRLPNGNTLINWAVEDLPKAQEIRPDGTVAFEMNFVDKFKTYRAFKFPWDGVAKQPALFVEPQVDNVTLIFNKFGDPNVDFYNIYAGRGANPTQVVASSKETLYKLTNLENRRRYFIRVTAVDKQGNESPFSNQEQVVVDIIQPGEEMVDNGTFADGKNNWDWLVRNGAQATWSIENSAAFISITNGGANDHDIQLTQAGIVVVQGRDYFFEFDAWADAPRTIEAKIAQNGGAFTDYSQLGLTALSRSAKRFSCRFRMTESSDTDARIVFNVGANTSDVHIANVSAKMVGETHVGEPSVATPDAVQLLDNYPNPFNSRTTIRFTAPEKSDMTVTLYNILGAQVHSRHAGWVNSGSHAITLKVDDLPSGVYLYRLSARNINGAVSYSHVKKMTLLR